MKLPNFQWVILKKSADFQRNLRIYILFLLFSGLQLLCNLGIDALSELFHAHGSLFATTLLTHRYQALGTLLLTNDNHVRNTLQLVVTNLAANLLVTVINESMIAGLILDIAFVVGK